MYGGLVSNYKRLFCISLNVICMGGLVSNYKRLFCISLNVICMGGLVSNYKRLFCISLNVICMGGLVSNYKRRVLYITQFCHFSITCSQPSSVTTYYTVYCSGM